jgi:AraC-like DNA-binding protein
MPSSDVKRFTDPDDYAAAIRHATVELTVTGRGPFAAQRTRIDLHRLWMQRFAVDQPLIAHIDNPETRAVISFLTQPEADFTSNGIDVRPTNIVRLKSAADSFLRSSGALALGSMSLPTEDMVAFGAAIAGRDLTPPRDAQIVTPPAAALARLRRLHEAAGHLADTAPKVIAQPEAARGLEQALVEAMVHCLAAGDAFEERAAQRRHRQIMQRFHRAIEQQPDRPLYVPEICKAIGVAERTLRLCCQEQLGTGPKHCLMTRRMHLARRDLSRADAATMTVTEIASRYGFWQFGHFAGIYRSLFGELPSATLARHPEERRPVPQT